jgi:methionine-rich copper-binding protein CopC
MKKVVLLGAFTLMILAGGTPAKAHMGVEDSTPKNASVVDEAPEVATIVFNSDVEIETATAQLRYLGGVDLPLSEVTNRDVKTERLTKLRGEGRTAVFGLPELESGTYALDWAVNEQGGHSNTSFILFKVDKKTSTNYAYIVIGVFVSVSICGMYLIGLRKK